MLGQVTYYLTEIYSTTVKKNKKKKLFYFLMCTHVKLLYSLPLWGKTNSVHNKSLVCFLNKHAQDTGWSSLTVRKNEPKKRIRGFYLTSCLNGTVLTVSWIHFPHHVLHFRLNVWNQAALLLKHILFQCTYVTFG